MAHHKATKKSIRRSASRRLRNRYIGKTTRNAIRTLRSMESKKEAMEALPKVISLVDKLYKHNVIHAKNASNLKSKLTKYVNGLS